MDDLSEATILVVDDAKANIDILVETLGEEYDVIFATDGESALEILEEENPDLILLDVMMPGIDGFETCRRIKSDLKTKHIPVIFVTAKTETVDILEGFGVGGVDYITKPFQFEEVYVRIQTHLELHFLRKKEEERMKSTMSRYLGSDLVETLMESGNEVMKTTNQDVTILFSDIRGFTSLTEELGAEGTVNLLNEYFSLMVDCIHKEKGMLDKFMGDAIMAIYGAPIAFEDHADRGVCSALLMIKSLKMFNQIRKKSGLEPIHIGIGLNSAPVVLGNIGSQVRMEYTVIGDGVNMAARLESACKIYGAPLLISEYTQKELKGNYLLRQVDRVYLKGKAKPRRVFEVLDHHTEESFPNMHKLIPIFEQGLKEFQFGKWETALQAFEESLHLNPNDMVSTLYIERCNLMIEFPLEETWEGIWTMETK